MNSARKILWPTLVLIFLLWNMRRRAEHKLKDEDCLACHADPSLTTDVNGKTISLFVDAEEAEAFDSRHR